MTYITIPKLPVKVDFLSMDFSGTPGNNPVFTLSGSLDNTRATLSNNEITLYEGSHWRLEASPQAFRVNVVNAVCYTQIYSVTNSQSVGFDGISSRNVLKRGRQTASALIKSSDISTSEIFQIQTQATSGQLVANDDPLYYYGILKIIELPA